MTRDEIEAGLARLIAGFMEPEISVLREEWYEVDGPCGIEWIPVDIAGDVDLGNGESIPSELAEYCENSTGEVSRITGYGARLSAPGYLDCTPWTVFPTLEDAEVYLVETYDDGEEEEE